MDQTEPAHQAFLRHVGECGEDANLDRGECLRASGHHQKGIGARNIALHFSTDFVSSPLREKTQISSAFLDIDDTFATTISSNQLNLLES